MILDIGIIDDGINTTYINSSVICMKNTERGILPCNAENVPIYSHGTICAKIIETYARRKIRFWSVQLLSGEECASVEDLLTALSWFSEHKVSILNLSIGTTNLAFSMPMQIICNDILSCGTIIIAAHNNNGRQTIPASFSNIIGVRQSNLFNREMLSNTDVWVNGGYPLIFGKKLFFPELCNSYACAYVSAYFIRHENVTKGKKNSIKLKWNRRIQRAYFDFDTGQKDIPEEYNFLFPQKRWLRAIVALRSADPEKSIIWCGKLKPLEKLCLKKKNTLFWDEKVTRYPSMPKIEITCPIVYCICRERQCCKITLAISSAFSQEGFQSIAVSNFQLAYLHGCYYVKNLSDNIQELWYVFRPDIIVIGVEDERFLEQIETGDIIVRVMDDLQYEIIINGTQERLKGVTEVISYIITEYNHI